MHHKMIATAGSLFELRYIEARGRVWPLLDTKEKILIEHIEQFYADPALHQTLIDTNLSLARALQEQLPSIREVYGVGHPYYGNVDVRKRVLQSMHTFLKKSSTKALFLQSILPDRDLLFVFKNSDGPYTVQKDLHDQCHDLFANTISRERKQFNEIWAFIEKEFNIAPREGNEYELFVSAQSLHIDFVPIPLTLFSKLHCFYELSDTQYLKYLRDIWFTTVPLVTKGGEATIASCRKALILNLLAGSPSTAAHLILHILLNHPHAPVIEMYNETQLHVTELFLQVIETMTYEGLITSNNNRIVTLTPAGETLHHQLQQEREDLFTTGFPIGD